MRRINVAAMIIGGAGLLACSESPTMPSATGSIALTSVVAECAADIAAVERAVGEVTFLSRQADKDRAGLLGKLANAQVKLDEGKLADAIGKLTDFRDTVIALRDAAKPKLSADDAQKLLDAVDVAIACMNALE
ncbi:MAG TPA: hypothetical protein VFZ24_07175 [Longimicrobiales bacterium]